MYIVYLLPLIAATALAAPYMVFAQVRQSADPLNNKRRLSGLGRTGISPSNIRPGALKPGPDPQHQQALRKVTGNLFYKIP